MTSIIEQANSLGFTDAHPYLEIIVCAEGHEKFIREVPDPLYDTPVDWRYDILTINNHNNFHDSRLYRLDGKVLQAVILNNRKMELNRLTPACEDVKVMGYFGALALQKKKDRIFQNLASEFGVPEQFR